MSAPNDVEDCEAEPGIKFPPLVGTERSNAISMLCELLAGPPLDKTELLQRMLSLKRKYSVLVKNSVLASLYREIEAAPEENSERQQLVRSGCELPNPRSQLLFRTKHGKSASGVLSVTVFTSPYPEYTNAQGNRQVQKFTCQWNCYFCPNHPKHPRSYLPDEPGCLRAERCGFDAVVQMRERIATLLAIGHPVDKLEVLVLGGTWESYPRQYQEEFCRDLFYAANTFFDADGGRSRLTLEEEQAINELTQVKIIGLTLETRPDTINFESVRLFRRYGCTRLQIGIQHTDDEILRLVNRRHDSQAAADGIRMLKDNCFKVDIHLMPDLPGASPEIDRAMFESLLGVKELVQPAPHVMEYSLVNDGLQADQWKIYPCEVTPWTVIEKWHNEGRYTPYGAMNNGEALRELLLWTKSQVFPWIRLNRVIRDIPNQHILGGNANELLVELRRRGLKCRCIRCREVGLSSLEESQRRPEAERSARRRQQKQASRQSLRELNQRRRAEKAATTDAPLQAGADESGNAAEGFDLFSDMPPSSVAENVPSPDQPASASSSSTPQPPDLQQRVDGAVMVQRRYNSSGGLECVAHAWHQSQRSPQLPSVKVGSSTYGPGFHLYACVALCSSPAAPDDCAFEVLHGAALVRELHVYGQLLPTWMDKNEDSTQHAGLGRRLMQRAEELAWSFGARSIAVIAGVGTRAYYSRLGYTLCDTFLVKLNPHAPPLSSSCAPVPSAAAEPGLALPQSSPPVGDSWWTVPTALAVVGLALLASRHQR